MVVHSLFLGDYKSFQLTLQSLISTSRADRILVYSYQLHCPLPGLFGTVLSFWRSSNLVRVFLHQGYDLAAIHGCNDVSFINQCSCMPSFPGAFQLGIFPHCIFTISWLISTSQYFLHSQIVFYSLSATQHVDYVLFLYARYHSKIWYYLQNSDDSVTMFFSI